MGDYIHIETKQVMSQGQWRNHYKNTSLPRTWTAATLEGLKLEPVFETPKPEAGQYQNVVRNGVEQDAKGNWVWAWEVRDMFSDYTDEEGVLHTKAEQEAAYQAELDSKVADANRTKRNSLLGETDYLALSDTNLTEEMAVYRQALRDITAHPNWPNLNDVDWPVKP